MTFSSRSLLRSALLLAAFTTAPGAASQHVPSTEPAHPDTHARGHGLLFTPDDGAPDDAFGRALSVSGNRALIGSLNDDDGELLSGAAYVFAFDGTSWAQEAKLKAPDPSRLANFGFAVALSGDRALIGAIGDGEAGPGRGAAYVFAFDGTSWVFEQKLSAPDPAGTAGFGRSVALSAQRAIVGAPGDDEHGNDSGAAYAFVFDGTTWVQEAKLIDPDPAPGEGFGTSVSLDGSRALVGVPNEGSHVGATYAFAHDGAVWSLEAKWIAPVPATRFGQTLSLSGDRALVGARQEGAGENERSGAAYVFAFDGASWQQVARLEAADGVALDEFGWSVDLVGDRALVSARRQASGAGAGYVFTTDGESWQEAARPAACSGVVEDNFGWSVAFAGETALVSATRSSVGGGVYAFDDLGTEPTLGLSILSHTRSPQRGDAVFFRARLTNLEPCPVRLRIYYHVRAPTGATKRTNVVTQVLPGDLSVQLQRVKPLRFRLPDDAPAGTYTVTLVAAAPLAAEETIYASDSFTFELPPDEAVASAASPPLPETGPNPFAHKTAIRYTLDADAEVDLRVFDAQGREVAVLARGLQTAGPHVATFAPESLPAGVYLWRLAVSGTVTTGRVTLAR